ncbi:MAG: chorismate synthase [Bacteroidales bacterium]|nr:chorismate synthase [Bacteroidales bacterium]
MNSFGRKFRVSIFGESHGEAIGVVLDGVQPGIRLGEEDFMVDILRRKSGSKGTTPRTEDDVPKILSGVYEGCTTGAPLTIIFHNRNTRSSDYKLFNDVPRPGHADFTASVKWMDFNDPRGGGHFSGRLTLPIVAAGVVAKKMTGFPIGAELIEVGGVTREEALKDIFEGTGTISTGGAGDFLANDEDEAGEKLRNDENESLGGVVSRDRGHGEGDSYAVGEDLTLSAADIWRKVLDAAIKEGDSVGGIVECRVNDIPAGLGEPFFDSVESLISHAVFSIPGVRGIEFGDGFRASRMKGSEHNDPFDNLDKPFQVRPGKNGAGGVNGGITNGNPIVFRVAFKPTSSISKPQRTYNFKTREMTTLQVPGRHDTCFALRTPVIVEAMTAIVLADLLKLQ